MFDDRNTADGGVALARGWQEWTREQKDHCLKETEVSFKMSGQVLRMLFAPPSA
jgi:hypothetical protein